MFGNTRRQPRASGATPSTSVGAGSIRVSPEYFQICFGVGIGFDFMRRIGD